MQCQPPPTRKRWTVVWPSVTVILIAALAISLRNVGESHSPG
jgi:hypothetical protein